MRILLLSSVTFTTPTKIFFNAYSFFEDTFTSFSRKIKNQKGETKKQHKSRFFFIVLLVVGRISDPDPYK
jgi:hypothetical protein